MARRTLLLTATTVLTASLAAADTPKPSPSPKPSPRTKSLAEVAREKKAASPAAKTAPSPEPSPGRVFTNEDLPAQPSPPAIASPGPAGTGRGTVTKLPPAAAGSTPSESQSQSRSSDVPLPRDGAEQESGWRGRAAALRDAISNAEKSIPEIEDRIAGLRNDRNPTNLMDPNREQNRQAEIAKAQAELESVRAGLERSRQALADLEEEARRKGIPPGWLR